MHLQQSVRLQEIRELNSALDKSNQAMREFVYATSHDLRAPLRNIKNIITIVSEDYEDQFDDQVVEYLARLQRTSERMDTLITDLLDYSQVSTESAPKELVALQELFDEILEDLDLSIQDRGAQIEVSSALPEVRGYASQLRQLCLIVDVHSLHALEQNDGRFVGVGGIVSSHRGERDGVQQAVAILMLKTFAIERSSAGGSAQQEPLARMSAAAQIRSPMRWNPNIE